MWIINEADSVRHYNSELLDDVVDDPVEDLPGEQYGIVHDGPVQVTKEVGELLVEEYESISEYNKES